MSRKYSVNQHLIETLLTWVKTGEIAIPEIQSPSYGMLHRFVIFWIAFIRSTLSRRNAIAGCKSTHY